MIDQDAQLDNPDAIVSFEERSAHRPLSDFADCYQGASTLDVARFRMQFWEVRLTEKWNLHMSTPSGDAEFSGISFVSYTREVGEAMHETAMLMKKEGFLGGWLSGNKVWGKTGVACSWMNKLPATPYYGAIYDNMAAVIIAKDDALLPAIWAFCSSPDFNTEVRKINQKVQVANATLVKVPFDLEHWKQVALGKWPAGLPKPHSEDPCQWVFHGHPVGSEDPLQVALSKLVGYQWPAEVDKQIELADKQRRLTQRCASLIPLTDPDGIVCIPSIRGEDPAADRLLVLLREAYGDDWTDTKVRELIAETGSKAKSLDDWLRNDFFEQHCKLFHHRPFIWHIWDGRKRDGFHALVNYHKLAEGDGEGRKVLEKLTHSYLGEWITRQKDGVARGEGGAEDRLAAAVELQKRLLAILKGEPPFDIFVRWKPLHQQAIGWNPDINDGVRLNIRPFMASDLPGGKKGAGILRWKPNIKWSKDRGKDPIRPKEEFPWFWDGDRFTGERHNDIHLTTTEKQGARLAHEENKA